MGKLNNILNNMSKKIVDTLSTSPDENVEFKTVGDLFLELLKTTSGTDYGVSTRFNIYNQIVGFKGVRAGIGTSTIVSYVAQSLAKVGVKVCVLDTSIMHPTQDIYLKRDTSKDEEGKVYDWFDMPYVEDNVLGVSKLSNNISILSFRNRTIVDMLSISDNADLVLYALEELKGKYDIILVDLCDEPTSITATCLQQCHMIFQVWSNDRLSLECITRSMENNLILSCSKDKMKNVIVSSEIDDVVTKWKTLVDTLDCKLIGSIGYSMDIAREHSVGNNLLDNINSSTDINQFIECINIICGKLLGMDLDNSHKGNVTVSKIMNGDVENTLSQDYKKLEEDMEFIVEDTNNAVSEMIDLEEGDKKC